MKIESNRFGVVEVSSLERVVTVALKGGGHGVQIVRQARVKDGVINARMIRLLAASVSVGSRP
jgi:hypothetical protein